MNIDGEKVDAQALWRALVERDEAKARAEAYRLAARRLAWVYRERVLWGSKDHSRGCRVAYMEWFRERSDIEPGPPPCTCGLDAKRGPRP